MRLYHYVGPTHIGERVRGEPAGQPVRSGDDVRRWVRATHQDLSTGSVVATFVVDESGALLIADRRSEHVVCAGGRPVRSAGEITFIIGETIEVGEVSNQSTGYCPEPESWPAVAPALEAAGWTPPDGYSLACVFRRCTECGSVNIVKDDLFKCAECHRRLPANYNL
jgi:hypothetical protein